MTPKDLKDLIKLLKKADNTIAKITKHRNELREQVDTLEAILETVSTGLDDFECGRGYIQTALDTMSQYL